MTNDAPPDVYVCNSLSAYFSKLLQCPNIILNNFSVPGMSPNNKGWPVKRNVNVKSGYKNLK